jgi:hypothetical protein
MHRAASVAKAEAPESSVLVFLRRFVVRPFSRFLQWLIPKILLIIILLVWFATVRAEHGWERFVLDLFLISFLLTVLFFAEALEIAYTFLSDKNPDQFGRVDGNVMKAMRARPDQVYEAREWLVIAIIVLVTLATEFDKIYFPFLGEIPNLRIPVNGWNLTVKSTHVFSLLFTTLPIIWFAQGPAKRVGLAASQQMIVNTKWVWWLIQKVDVIVKSMGLNRPAEYIAAKLLKQGFTSKDNFSPSDQGFFLAALQRYGFALHDLSLTIQLHEHGACTVKQKFALYLVRYPRTTFFRQMRFPNSEALPPELFSAIGYECKSVGANYEDLCELLHQISLGNCPNNATISSQEMWTLDNQPLDRDGKLTGNQFGAISDKPPAGVRFGITADNPVPPSGVDAFAFWVEWCGKWKGHAFNVTSKQEDYFEMRFDYPCRSYELRILKEDGATVFFRDIKAEATLMNNPHEGEQLRLDNARIAPKSKTTLLHAKLMHPLPGANYKYSWKIRRSTG